MLPQQVLKNLINLGSSCMYPREINNTLNEEFILQGELSQPMKAML